MYKQEAQTYTSPVAVALMLFFTFYLQPYGEVGYKQLKDWLDLKFGYKTQVYCSCICYSVSKSCPPLCNPKDCSRPGFPVLGYPPEFAQTHVH